MNKKYQAEELISKYHQGTASPEERLLVEQWFLIDLEQSHILPDAEAVKKADQKISSNLQAYIQGQAADKKTYKLWKHIAAAAAVLLVVGLGVFFYTSYYAPRHLEGSATTRDLLANDIKPGGNKAYLILSNGKRLSLTDAANGELAKEAGVEITKTADGQVIYSSQPLAPSGRDAVGREGALNIIETPRGGQYQIRLPDGSKVWLNAASKLIYPVSFNGRGQRVVELSGEAYFEIFKNKLQPFVVKSKNQEVTVLGTHFNINSYADEPDTKTTLLEGSVSVRHLEGSAATRDLSYRRDDVKGEERFGGVVLKPGQQSTIDRNRNFDIQVQEVQNLEAAVAWKNGTFMFTSEPIQVVMRKVARWYDVDVEYKTTPDTRKYTGAIARTENISQILALFERMGTVKFEIVGKKIIVK
ncbi:anti-sigma factor [Pedobacter sp. HMWF019]|uniref:FecR family protein n=1 Tax=Pedobacter sp. HMWF019 TaxID=2056856 RepID=UPI000D3D9E80|nr:FecR family protein [Pedobacter sp. HMWF019]PTT02454.1 anti-sigma factor [Pedobacter sp. HMWF019]